MARHANTKEPVDPENTSHYINNKEFLRCLIEYQADIVKCKEEGKSKPYVTDYIAMCFLQIAQRLSYRPNFINYTYKDDMISDGLENCLAYMHNFNPDKSKNPFAYFTQIIYYAFLRRIQKEKKQLEIKSKILEKSSYDEVMHTDTYDGSMSGMNASYADMGSIKENIETKMNR